MKILNDEFALIKIDVNEHYYINKKGDVYSTYTNKILRLKTAIIMVKKLKNLKQLIWQRRNMV